jgi:hypothetical protein|tara:strand:+ start:240 stop:1070 length:831 start_codon:yes stop_codon:yes gene_type:complete
MKIKHNKKRNTAFVYEALIREATVSIIKQDDQRKDKVFSIIKKHFNQDSLLYKDLECYRSLYEDTAPNEEMANKILLEVKAQKRLIDPSGLFTQQTALIHDVNKELTPETFNNFVPNYRCLATIQQILSVKASPKTRVMLEGEIIKNMVVLKENKDAMPTVDNLTYRQFVGKFNEKYDNKLLKEQKDLLQHYVTSFSDNSLQLKMFLNEEIARLKSELNEAKEIACIKEDDDMMRKTEQVISKLEGFAKETINENVLFTVLKTQSLVQEIYNGDNN